MKQAIRLFILAAMLSFGVHAAATADETGAQPVYGHRCYYKNARNQFFEGVQYGFHYSTQQQAVQIAKQTCEQSSVFCSFVRCEAITGFAALSDTALDANTTASLDYCDEVARYCWQTTGPLAEYRQCMWDRGCRP